MKNRTLGPRKNGKFFCRHAWEVDEPVGPDWDINIGVKIFCLCTKCGRRSRISNFRIAEIPDKLINPRIAYRP